MTTLQKVGGSVHRLQTQYITKAKHRRFQTGVRQLALRAFTSLNAAGRNAHDNRSTGENRIRRTVTDTGLADQLQRLLLTELFAGRHGYWYCSLDHSQFGSFCIAVLAVSNRAGRAIPVWCQVNLSEAALMVPLLVALEELLTCLREIAPKLHLVLVMDRWFAADQLFTLIAHHGCYFIARTKADRRVKTSWDQYWERSPVGEVSSLETLVAYRQHELRLMRSELRPGMKAPEPWFLFTNLPTELTRRQVLNRYQERFEIEESFKDLKWLMRLEWQCVKKPNVIRSLVLFTFLGWWLLWRYVAKNLPHHCVHPKKRLSWFRLAWEQWQRLTQPPLLSLLT